MHEGLDQSQIDQHDKVVCICYGAYKMISNHMGQLPLGKKSYYDSH